MTLFRLTVPASAVTYHFPSLPFSIHYPLTVTSGTRSKSSSHFSLSLQWQNALQSLIATLTGSLLPSFLHRTLPPVSDFLWVQIRYHYCGDLNFSVAPHCTQSPLPQHLPWSGLICPCQSLYHTPPSAPFLGPSSLLSNCFVSGHHPHSPFHLEFPFPSYGVAFITKGSFERLPLVRVNPLSSPQITPTPLPNTFFEQNFNYDFITYWFICLFLLSPYVSL